MGFTQISLSYTQTSDCAFSLEIEWQKQFGGSNSEILQNSRSLSDGGYIMGGHTLSDDGDVLENYGGVDYWIVKTDANGNEVWSKNLGGASTDIGSAVVETSDNGLLFAGSTLSNDVDITAPIGSYDVWIMKLDANGNSQFDRSYGGTGNDRPEWIEKTTDGGIVICGTTSSFDGDFNENKGISDAMVIKLDQFGNVQWTRTVGGSSEDFANHIQATNDGGYIVCGGTFSFDGDVSLNNGDADALVFKLDANGNVQWVRTLGGSGIEWANWNIQTSDGGYLLTGPTDSKDGDFAKNNGGRDLWVLKLDALGNTQWRQVYGGNKDDLGNAIVETSINGFLIAGHAELPTGDVSNNYGNLDVWVLNCDENGFLIADYNYGGSSSEMTEDLRFTNDGGLILSGFSESDDFDLAANNGQADFWAIKFKPLSSGLSTPDLGADREICEAENILLDANVTGCVNCSFLWSDGNTSATRIVNVTETTLYSVVITDESGCSVSDDIQISLTDLDLNVSFEHPSGCVEDGTITASAQGGTGDYSYSWSNGMSGSMISNLSAGIYRVTIDDGNCSKEQLVLLQSQNANFPEVNLGEDQTICANSVTNLNVPSDLFAMWSTGENENSIVVSDPGYYTVTVTNTDGCTAVDAINIFEADEINLDLGEDQISCSSEIIISTNLTDENFMWSTGSTENQIVVNESGTYSVIVTDAFGCTKMDQIEAVFYEPIELDLGEDLSSCEPIELTSPVFGTNYAWSNGGVTDQTLIEETGTYELVLTDDNGCTAIDEIFVEILETPIIDLGENLSSCEPIGVTLIDQENDVLWSTGSIENRIVVEQTDWYQVTVTNVNGCTAVDSIFVEILNASFIDIEETYTSCQSIVLDYSDSEFSFEWSNETFESTIEILESGMYTVTVTNDVNCSSVESFTVDIVDELIIELGEDLSSCEEISINAGQPGLNYSWSTGESEYEIIISTSGLYAVTITDDMGCSSEDEINIEIFEEVDIDLGADISSCAGVNLDGQGVGLTYLWSTGSTEPTIEVSESGQFVLEVTNANGCTNADTINVEIADEMLLDLGADIVSCVAVNIDGQGEGLTYLWSDGSTESSVEVSESGQFILEVSNPNGCTDVDTINVEIVDEIPLDLGGDIVSCQTVNINSGFEDDNLNYLWSDGTTDNEIEVLESGTYSLTITDPSGCSAIDELEVEIQTPLEFDLGEDLIECGSILVSADVEAETYNWSNGSTEPTTIVDDSGTLTLTITNGADCESKDSIEVTITDGFDLDVVIKEQLCFGENDASILLDAQNAIGTVEYNWEDGVIDSKRENLAAGTYEVTVIDEAGCEQIRSFEIFEPTQIQIELISITHIGCGNSTGSILVETTGGTGELELTWDNISGQSGELNSAEAGVFALLVTDENGCSATAEYEILQNAQLEAETELISEIDCTGNTNGAVSINVMSGVAPYTFSWDNTTTGVSASSSEAILTELAAGDYLVTIVDASDCQSIVEFVLLEPEPIDLLINAFGFCGDFGYAVPTISGGTEPYEYLWDNGANSELITQLSSGIYTLTITDANGCSQTQETEINNFEEVLFEVSNSEPSCFGAEDAFVVIEVIQGNPPFQYDWTNGATSSELINIGGGDYTVFVTDANGCSTAATVDITEPSEIGAQVNSTPDQDGGNSGSIELLPFGGKAPYTFLWEDGSTSSMRFGLGNGTYFVTITDQNGCQTEREILLASTVGTLDLILDQLSLTPNPTNGILFIDALHQYKKTINLEIYNSLGQIIYTTKHLGQNISLEVDLTAFSSGIYFVRFKSETKTSISKPIVKL